LSFHHHSATIARVSHPPSFMESWHSSNILRAHMEALIKRGLLQVRTKVHEWIMPGDEEVPMPPAGYVISFMPFHERGLMVPPTDSSRGCFTTMALSCSP
jgi:hypothetical protein